MIDAGIFDLDLESLGDGIPVLPRAAAGSYKQNCMVCLDSEGHSRGVNFHVDYHEQGIPCRILWSDVVTDHLRRAYRDEAKTTDFGACAIALLFVRDHTDFDAIEQSNVGTTIDYFLARKHQTDDTLIFNHAAYLEVSGIRAENATNSVDRRISEKAQRLSKPEDLPTLIMVVEFSRPRAKVVEL